MLQKMVPTMCEEAGITCRTNHSLHAIGATDMFCANIPEKVIQSHTGHLSLKALRMYGNPTDEQHSAACSVLVDRQNVTPPEVLKPTQSLAGPVLSTMVQAPVQLITPLWCAISPLWFSPKLHNQRASVQPGINSELPENEYFSHCSCGR